jgi:hypothetical protein
MQRLIYTNLVGSQGSAALKDEYHLSVCLSAEFIDGCLNHSFGHVTHRNPYKVLLAVVRRIGPARYGLLQTRFPKITDLIDPVGSRSRPVLGRSPFALAG